MQTKKTHWPSLLILATLGIGAAFVLLISLGFGASSIIGLFTKGVDPAGGMISSFAFGFEFLLLLVCSWFVLQKTMGREQAGHSAKFPFANWHVIVAMGVIIFSAIVGGLAAYTEITWLTWIVLPILTIIIIALPIWILLSIGTNGIELGPRWRVFGIFGLGMTVGPLIMIALETILLLVIIIAAVVMIAVQNPDLFQKIISLSQRIQTETDPDLILKLLSPYIINPAVIATLLGYIAFLVPLIEELLKPLAVWIFARKIDTPAQGFAMGMLSGAAFALLESLNASGDGSTSWTVIVSVRAGTSLLHMSASGLVGWGIVSAFHDKKVLRFFGAYFSAVAIHGIWNACAVGAGISTIGQLIDKPEWLFNIIPAAACGMSVLGIGMLAVLIASNRKLRSAAAPIPSIEEKNDEEIQQIL
jgi:hypothetical protein